MKHLLPLIIFLCLSAKAKSTISCNEPILQNFGLITSTSAEINFIDVNGGQAESWQIELVTQGSNPTGSPTHVDIESNNYTISQLSPGMEYSIYLRAVCDKGPSDWNGPYAFFTNFTNGESCIIDIGIKDESCTNFYIEVSDLSSNELGNNIFVEEIKLAIEHTWPQDLIINLSSPNGKTVLLSERNGTNSDHYGDPFNTDCINSLNFNNKACLTVDEILPPLIGTFKPEGDINKYLDGSDPNGIWTLEICDEAKPDVGRLKFVDIEFSEEICPVPSVFVAKNIDDTQAQIQWSPPFNCLFLEAVWGELGFDPNAASVFTIGCQSGEFTISNLQANTTYEVFVKSKCNLSDSPFSCSIVFTTECMASTDRLNFDDKDLCQTSCLEDCTILGNWNNSLSDDQDWLVHQGETPTTFTGPENDAFEFGNYIYIENAPTVCDSGAVAQLLSKCIEIETNNTECAKLKFAYHMFGLGINTLELKLSENQGQHWITIFEKNGSQSQEWLFEEIDLFPYAGRQILLSFEAFSGSAEGDIALDQIELFGAHFINDGELFYVDSDLDGFGSSDSLRYCGLRYPGISQNNLDCNDEDPNINPEALELPCNLIDENCNGNSDDSMQTNPVIYTIENIQNESCLGSSDGTISLSFSQGSPPYDILWNNGLSGDDISGLGKGVYFATVTDGTGCKTLVDFIEIDANTELQVFSSMVIPPSCPGKSDGQMAFNVTGGMPPYSFFWNNLSQDSVAQNLSEGSYSVVITDVNGCQIETSEIVLDAPEAIQAGVQFKTDIDCFGDSTAQIALGFTEANFPVDVIWNTGDSGTSVSNLGAGIYACTITDTEGCQLTLSDIEITQNDSLRIFVEGIENVRCHGEADGKIEITVIGGDDPYAYSWSNGAFTEDLFNIPKGSYALTLTDFKGCKYVLDTLWVTEPDPIQINLDSIEMIACPFSNNGEITLEAFGGTAPYSYFWDHTDVDTNALVDLESGTYSLNIIDAFNCKASIDTLQILAINAPLEVDVDIEQNNLCFNDSIGIISSITNSDRFPLDFNWNSGTQNIRAQNVDTLYNLPNGTYNVTITDDEGCVGVSSFLNIFSPDRLEYAVVSLKDVLCYQDSTGEIVLGLTGGVQPYQVSWNSGHIGNAISGIPAGNYSFEVLDSNQCKIIGNLIEISQPDSLTLDADIINDSNGQGIGQISINMDGGVPFYFYTWSENANTLNDNIADMLTTGTYLLNVKDANDCSIDTSFFVDNITSLDKILLDDLNIYHNHQGQCLEFQLPEKAVVKIVDQSGRLVENYTLQAGPHTLSLMDYSTGIHFVHVSIREKSLTKKIIILN